jgi:hypothetical protein
MSIVTTQVVAVIVAHPVHVVDADAVSVTMVPDS